MAETPAPFKVLQLTEKVAEVTLYIQATVMDRSLLVWVDTEPVFKTLSVALSSAPNGAEIVSTPLLGHSIDDTSDRLASLLARRTGYQVFASCRVPELGADDFFNAAVRRLTRELAAVLPPKTAAV